VSEEVARYYREKTHRILRKYGPGPRVHFHAGLRAEPPEANATEETLRAAMVRAQERLTASLAVPPRSRVLDVGCGLGGTAIYLAEMLRAEVTAITIVPHHVELVGELAKRAGVSNRVRARACDAHAASTMGRFDTAVAVESSCYFDRPRWFGEMSKALVGRGKLHVVDCFAADPSIAPRFDGYWRTRIGTLDEYRRAADAAGLEEVEHETWNDQVADFWLLTRAWTGLELRRSDGDGERERLEVSLREHEWLEDSIRSGAIRYLKLVYERS
jgi:tocopherol O-methyltransferase